MGFSEALVALDMHVDVLPGTYFLAPKGVEANYPFGGWLKGKWNQKDTTASMHAAGNRA